EAYIHEVLCSPLLDYSLIPSIVEERANKAVRIAVMVSSIEEKKGVETVEPIKGLYKLTEDHGLKPAIVTNSPRPNAELMILTLGLTDFFLSVIIDGKCEHAKPAPDPYLMALEVLNVSKEHAFICEGKIIKFLKNKTGRSIIKRYINTTQNGEALRKCILSGPYKPTTVLVQAVEATDDSSAVPEHTTVETPMNMSPENKAHFEAEKEAIHLILTGIGDEIYSTVDACETAQGIKFTSHDGESMESYYMRFYKLMNEMIRNNLTVTTMQVNVQFLQQLQPEWSKSQAPSSKSSIPNRSNTTTRHKGKEIAKPITPPSETASEEDIEPEQAQRDKDMQKNLTLIAKYYKKIYKPTNNNLRTSSTSKNKNVDTTLRFKNDNQSGKFRNQRTVNVAAARENVAWIFIVFTYSGTITYDWLEDTNEKVDEQELEVHCIYMAKLQEVPNADTCTDSEPVKQVQNNAKYNVFANDLQHSESVSNTCLVEIDDSNVIPDSPDMYEDDERVALANLIANLKLDVDENKKIQKQLKKANTTLAQELKECKTILAETSKSLGESISV
nr:haloacid dehalogenase-like hydrolase domain-containing protein Sgpp [Tanacetum cinerariifolium]